jgi:hypothetical protein
LLDIQAERKKLFDRAQPQQSLKVEPLVHPLSNRGEKDRRIKTQKKETLKGDIFAPLRLHSFPIKAFDLDF